MTDIMPWGKGKSPKPRTAREIVQEANLAALKVDGVAYVARTAQDRVVDLDHHRQLLAGDDQMLSTLLAEVELAFLRKATSLTASMYEGFGR